MVEYLRLPENMTNKLNIVLIGCGEMSRHLVMSTLRKGANIAAVLDMEDANLASELSKAEPNCVIFSINNPLEYAHPSLKTCIQSGTNILIVNNGMPCADYSFTEKLDELSQSNYSTVMEVEFANISYSCLTESVSTTDGEMASDLIIDKIVDCMNGSFGFVRYNLTEPTKRYSRPLNEYVLI